MSDNIYANIDISLIGLKCHSYGYGVLQHCPLGGVRRCVGAWCCSRWAIPLLKIKNHLLVVILVNIGKSQNLVDV